MNYLKNYTMIDFLRWMTAKHPEIQRWTELKPDKVIELTKEFEEGTQAEKRSYEDQWFENLNWYYQPRNCGRDHVWEDPLERYRKIPLHTLFLYTSMNKGIDSYIEDNWCALHKLSANYCDIHPVKSQLESDHNKVINEDANDFLEKSRSINTKHPIEFSDLPGMFFWNHTGEEEYVSFLVDQSYEGISKSITIIIEEIKKEPTIHAVKRAKRKVEKQETLPDLLKRLFPQTYSVWSLVGVGLTSLAVWAAFASTGSNNFIATIFLIIGLALCGMFLLILVVESLHKIWVSHH